MPVDKGFTEHAKGDIGKDMDELQKTKSEDEKIPGDIQGDAGRTAPN